MSRAAKGWIVVLVCTAFLLLLLRTGTGFLVVQPLGAVPKGTTIWYVRAGLNLPFIESADGFVLRETGEISLLTRGVALTRLVDAMEGRTIAKLPYSRRLYIISTGGVEFDR